MICAYYWHLNSDINDQWSGLTMWNFAQDRLTHDVALSHLKLTQQRSDESSLVGLHVLTDWKKRTKTDITRAERHWRQPPTLYHSRRPCSGMAPLLRHINCRNY